MPQKNTFISIKFNFRKAILWSLLLMLVVPSQAATGNWASTVTGGNIVYTATEATSPVKDFTGNYLTVVYLENLSCKKIGQNTNATDVAWLLSKGYRVIELNYANNSNAITPTINADINAINTAINAGSFCGFSNCSKYKAYVLFEGYRITRNVSYFKDEPTIYNYIAQYTTGDSLHMDIIYPANPSATVPIVLSFSYSNSYPTYDSSSGLFTDTNRDQRLNLGNTLAGFKDSFLEGAPANGIAWAIADHPKYCPWGNGKPVGATNNKAYASYETNPDAAQKVKSAVRTLRALGTNLGLSGKIGIYGFSRGSTAGSMAVGDRTVASFENAGNYVGTSDDVQVAALGSGVFDYTLINNGSETDAPSYTTNCPAAWGAMSTNYATWQLQGAAYLAQSVAAAPVIFFYNTDDALYYQDQIKHFKARLDSLGVPTSSITNYGTGHAVPQTSASLTTVYDFFNKYLTPPSVKTAIFPVYTETLSFTLSPNPCSDKIRLTFNLTLAAKVLIELYNTAGVMLYKTEENCNALGVQSETIQLDELNLTQGVYFLKVASESLQGVQKFIKVK
jgi:dienelactone hydrolase